MLKRLIKKLALTLVILPLNCCTVFAAGDYVVGLSTTSKTSFKIGEYYCANNLKSPDKSPFHIIDANDDKYVGYFDNRNVSLYGNGNLRLLIKVPGEYTINISNETSNKVLYKYNLTVGAREETIEGCIDSPIKVSVPFATECVCPDESVIVRKINEEQKSWTLNYWEHFDYMLYTHEIICDTPGQHEISFGVNSDDKYSELYHYTVNIDNHDWSEDYTIDKESTCSETGLMSVHCKRCNTIKDKKVLDKKEHTWESIESVDVPSTCSVHGSQSIHCSVCGEIKAGTESELPLLPHEYTSLITKPSTETDNGIRTYVCTVCGNSYEESIPKGTALESCKTKATLLQEAKDEYDQLVSDSTSKHDASVLEIRRKINEIKLQGYFTGTDAEYRSKRNSLVSQKQELERKILNTSSAALKAQYQAQLDEIQDQLDDLEAKYSNTMLIRGNETAIDILDESLEKALKAYKEAYDSKVAEINLLRDDGHTEMIDEAVEATCDHPGKSEGSHCSVCGKVLIKQETYPQLEHNWDQGVVTEEATCSQVGVLTFTCDKCKQTYTQEIPKLKHIPNDNSTIDQEATCIDAGSKSIHCSLCGETIEGTEESIPALGHDFGDWIVTTEPSCTETGTKEHVCARCGEKEEEVIPGGHDWDDGVVTTPAKCTETGIMTITCTRCKNSRTEEIPATGHTEETIPGKAATCVEDGLTAGKKCSTCGEILEEQKEIPATGQHTWDAGTVTTKPTTTAAGVKTFTCTVCGETKTESVAKLPPAAPPADPVLGNVTTLESKAKALPENGDPAGSSFRILQVKGKKVKKTSITIAWKAVPKAAGYVVYGAPCGSKYAKLKDIKATSFTQTGLKKGKYYKYFVAAHDKNGKILASSKTVHIATSGGKKGNTKSVKLNKKKATLKKGKTLKLKAKLKNGKLKVSKHRKVAYESDNPRVATVSKSGKVKAVGKGKCTVYAYAQNGVFAKCKITVK